MLIFIGQIQPGFSRLCLLSCTDFKHISIFEIHISVILMHIGLKNSSLYHGLIIYYFLSSPIVLDLFFHM